MTNKAVFAKLYSVALSCSTDAQKATARTWAFEVLSKQNRFSAEEAAKTLTIVEALLYERH